MIAAINRFKNVVNNYEETVFITRHYRLVELHYNLGLVEEFKIYHYWDIIIDQGMVYKKLQNF